MNASRSESQSAKDNIKIDINHAAFLALHSVPESEECIHSFTRTLKGSQLLRSVVFFAIINATFAPLTNICASNAFSQRERASGTSAVLFDRTLL